MEGYNDCDHWEHYGHRNGSETQVRESAGEPLSCESQWHTAGYHELGSGLVSQDPALNALEKEVKRAWEGISETLL